jgi:hypothetical protein
MRRRCVARHEPKRTQDALRARERAYRSEDGGAELALRRLAAQSALCLRIGIDPVNPDNMFVGTGTPTPAMLLKNAGRTG